MTTIRTTQRSTPGGYPMRRLLAILIAAGLPVLALAARNSAGSYALPSGNPVVSGTTITNTWANTTLGDLANELTLSLDRSGRGSMLAPLRVPDGSSSFPTLSFSAEPGLGFWRATTSTVRLQALGNEVQTWSPTFVTIRPSLSLAGDLWMTTAANQSLYKTGGGLYLSTGDANDVGVKTNSLNVFTFKADGNFTLDAAGAQTFSKTIGGLGFSVPTANAITFAIASGPTFSINSLGASLTTGTLTGLATPSASSDAATKGYVDGKYGWAKVSGAACTTTCTIERSGGGLALTVSRSGTGAFTIAGTNLHNGVTTVTVSNATTDPCRVPLLIDTGTSGQMGLHTKTCADALVDTDFMVQAWVP